MSVFAGDEKHSRLGFLDLPEEIRIMIYEYAMPQHYVVQLAMHTDRLGIAHVHVEPNAAAARELLLITKRLFSVDDGDYKGHGFLTHMAAIDHGLLLLGRTEPPIDLGENNDPVVNVISLLTTCRRIYDTALTKLYEQTVFLIQPCLMPLDEHDEAPNKERFDDGKWHFSTHHWKNVSFLLMFDSSHTDGEPQELHCKLNPTATALSPSIHDFFQMVRFIFDKGAIYNGSSHETLWGTDLVPYVKRRMFFQVLKTLGFTVYIKKAQSSFSLIIVDRFHDCEQYRMRSWQSLQATKAVCQLGEQAIQGFLKSQFK